MRKRLIIFICLVAMMLPQLWAASTEGKEFWVALTIARGPEDKGGSFEPFVCISSKTGKGNITISAPNGWTETFKMLPNGFLKISERGVENDLTGLNDGKSLDPSIWYPYKANEQGQQKASGQTFNKSLKITSDVDVSVFAAIRYEYAMDASNILPITALQTEYITQDYPPFANGSPSTSYSNFCILATEDNTEVEITPYAKTYDGKPAKKPFTIKLPKAGDVYYVVSEQSTEVNNYSSDSHLKSLSGSHVKCTNGKKIAVFNGNICTRIPNGSSDRDITYEQAMPIDYWGTEFVVTRSIDKHANRIRITAMQDETTITINGVQVSKTLSARETVEYELAVKADISSAAKGNNLPSANQIIDSVMTIQSSCPVAVYSYDTGNAYKSKTATETASGDGAPSMTWVSPLEQRIKNITFGAMHTDRTKDHFINVIVRTEDVEKVVLNKLDEGGKPETYNWLPSNLFTIVPKMPEYSYARVQLNSTRDAGETYNLQSPQGFIAHVYGNGEDESYAYSAGSSAVARGIYIGEFAFTTDPDPNQESRTFCLGDSLHFNPQYNTHMNIESTHWDMGDGVTFDFGKDTVDFKYKYESPGWYDVKVSVTLGFDDCTGVGGETYEVLCTFYVNAPDTVRRNIYGCKGEPASNGQIYTESQLDTLTYDCDSVVIYNIQVGEPSPETRIDATGYDSYEWNGTTYTQSGEYKETLTNISGCDSVVILNLTIITCLDLTLGEVQPIICGDDETFSIPYTINKGEISKAEIICDKQTYPANIMNTHFEFDKADFVPGHYNAVLRVTDAYCPEVLEFPIEFEIRYPSSIFAQKWDHVWAVYNENYNGGYTFTAFQWYRNGEPIAGATGSWYDNKEPFNLEDEYTVLLTRKDGVQLFACPKNAIDKTQSVSAASAQVSPTVVSGGEAIHITADMQGEAVLFNTLGVEQWRAKTSADSYLTMPKETGVYLLQITLSDGTRISQQLIVK